MFDAEIGFESSSVISLISVLDPGTNSELSNTSEPEDVNEREQRPRGTGGDERGSRRGNRGRGSNSGRGRGGPGSKPSNSISSGRSNPRLTHISKSTSVRQIQSLRYYV